MADTRATMLNLSRQMHNNELIDIVMNLAEESPFLQDAPFFEANDTTSHVIARTAALPSNSWRQLNAGIDATKGETVQLREYIGLLESRSEIDEDLVLKAPDPVQFRRNMDLMHLESLGQEIEDAIVDGDMGTTPASFNGFSTRIDALSETSADGRETSVTYGGSGSDVMSIWIVQWGVGKVYMVYPRNDRTIGIQEEDRDVERVLDSSSSAFYAYVTKFKWNGGLVVEDDRCLRRVANIETSSTSNNLLDSSYDVEPIMDALMSMKDKGNGATIYTNRTGLLQFMKAAKDKTNVQYLPDNPWGQPTYSFMGHPLRVSDAIVTESAIS